MRHFRCNSLTEDLRYEGGIFSAVLNFPADFPNNPPEMKLGPQERQSTGSLAVLLERCGRNIAAGTGRNIPCEVTQIVVTLK